MMQKWIYLQRGNEIQRVSSQPYAAKLVKQGWRVVTAADFKRKYEVVERADKFR